jgi:hypothetical protein
LSNAQTIEPCFPAIYGGTSMQGGLERLAAAGGIVNTERGSPSGLGVANRFSFTQYSVQRASIAPSAYVFGRPCGVQSEEQGYEE